MNRQSCCIYALNKGRLHFASESYPGNPNFFFSGVALSDDLITLHHDKVAT